MLLKEQSGNKCMWVSVCARQKCVWNREKEGERKREREWEKERKREREKERERETKEKKECERELIVEVNAFSSALLFPVVDHVVLVCLPSSGWITKSPRLKQFWFDSSEFVRIQFIKPEKEMVIYSILV